MSRRAITVSPVDVGRAWSQMVTAIGPIALPDDLDNFVADIVNTGFNGRLATIPSTTSLRWRRSDSVAQPVIRYPATDRDGLDEVVTRFARETLGRGPFLAATAGDYLLLSINHGWGDARLAIRLNELFTRGEVEVAPTARKLPLATAVTQFFGKNREMFKQVVKSRLPGAASAAPEIPVVSAEPTGQQLWSRSPRMVSASVDVSVIDDIRRRRKTSGSKASVSSFLFAAAMRELQQAGIARHPGVNILFDCRRYLDGVTDPLEVNANFVSAVEFPFPDVPTPEDVHANIRAAADSGRPLLSATMTSAIVGARVARHQAPSVAVAVEVPARARLGYSDPGLVPFPESVWTGDVSQRFFNTLSEPAEPDGLMITFLQAGGGLHVTASFHDNVFDAAAMREAVERVARNPLPEEALGAQP